MSFLGKEYKFEKEENFGAFLKGIGLPEEQVTKYLEYKPTFKIEKDGDSYVATNITPAGSKSTKFLSGVEFDDKLKDLPIKTTYTVDGNKVTQVINTDNGSVTFVREFNGNELVVTITSSIWDGTAKRYYKV